MIELIIVIGWALSGWLAYGYTFAYFQREYPKDGARGDRFLALFMGVAGPLGLVVAWPLSGRGKHGRLY